MDSRTVMELVLVAVLAVLGIAMTVCESRRVTEPTTVQTTPYRSVLISGMTAALAATVLFVAALWEHAGMYSILAAGAARKNSVQMKDNGSAQSFFLSCGDDGKIVFPVSHSDPENGVIFSLNGYIPGADTEEPESVNVGVVAPGGARVPLDQIVVHRQPCQQAVPGKYSGV